MPGRLRIVILLAGCSLAAALVGCSKPGTVATPAAPTSVTAAQASQLLAAAVKGAETLVETLRNQGTITEADTRAVQAYLQAVIAAGQQSDRIIAAAPHGADLSAAQKVQIGEAWAQAVVSLTKLSPGARAVTLAVQTAVNTILAAAGVPVQ